MSRLILQHPEAAAGKLAWQFPPWNVRLQAENSRSNLGSAWERRRRFSTNDLLDDSNGPRCLTLGVVQRFPVTWSHLCICSSCMCSDDWSFLICQQGCINTFLQWLWPHEYEHMWIKSGTLISGTFIVAYMIQKSLCADFYCPLLTERWRCSIDHILCWDTHRKLALPLFHTPPFLLPESSCEPIGGQGQRSAQLNFVWNVSTTHLSSSHHCRQLSQGWRAPQIVMEGPELSIL